VLNLVRVDIKLEARLGRVDSEVATSLAHGGNSVLSELTISPLWSCEEAITEIRELELTMSNQRIKPEKSSVRAVLPAREVAGSLRRVSCRLSVGLGFTCRCEKE
jgi:hypothetical protein